MIRAIENYYKGEYNKFVTLMLKFKSRK